jgi:hypothetical protein
MLMSRVICQTNWNSSFYVVFQSIISHGGLKGAAQRFIRNN